MQEQIETKVYELPGRELPQEEREAYLERLERLVPVRQGADTREVLVYSGIDGEFIGCYVLDIKEEERAKVQSKGFVPGLRFARKDELMH